MKVKFYRTTIRPTTLYDSECWAAKVQDECCGDANVKIDMQSCRHAILL